MSTAKEKLTLPKFHNRIPKSNSHSQTNYGEHFFYKRLFNLFSLVLKEQFSIDLIHT